MFKRKILPTALVVASAAALVSAVTIAQGDSPERDHLPDAPELRAFAGERTGDDALPALAASELRAVGPVGTRIDESVRAVADGDAAVYLTPAPGGACLSLVEPAGATVSCVPEAAFRGGAARPGSMITACKSAPPRQREPGTVGDAWPRCTGDLVLYGVASDDTAAVTVEFADGSTAPATLARNAYLVRVPLERRPVALHAAGDGIEAVQPLRQGAWVR